MIALHTSHRHGCIVDRGEYRGFFRRVFALAFFEVEEVEVVLAEAAVAWPYVLPLGCMCMWTLGLGLASLPWGGGGLSPKRLCI
jgi:hypothetical protein